MKKNKGLFFVLAVLLAVACLLVSCNSEVASNDGGGEKLVYATFGNTSKATRPEESTMTQSYTVDSIDDVYWVYTATKDDAYGIHGQQTSDKRVNSSRGLSGAIGPFSKGYWNFTVKGYKYTGSSTEIQNPTVAQLAGAEYSLIFVGSVSHFLLNTDNTNQNPAPIPVTVYLQTEGGAGTLTVKDGFKFFWKEKDTVSGNDLKLKIYLDESTDTSIDAVLAPHSENSGAGYYELASTATKYNSNIAAGDHELKAKVVKEINDNTELVFFEGTLPIKIYSGQTTEVDMNLVEGSFVWGQFNGTLDLSSVVVAASTTKTFADSSDTATFTVDYTPASNGAATTENITTVVFSNANTEGASVKTGEENTSYNLGVTVSNVEAVQSKFTVVDEVSNAFASIDLNLTKTVGETAPQSVTEFNGGQIATVTTYIAQNLTSLKVYYKDQKYLGQSDTGYVAGAAGTYTYNSSTR